MNDRRVLMITALGAALAVFPRSNPPSLVWNASASVPIGLYAVAPISQLQVGDLVVVMAPEPLASFLAAGGYLPRGVPLLKRVAALSGQTICRAGLAITIDAIATGEARERDGRGRALPVWRGCRVVANGEVFLMNRQSDDSLDGRYFGAIPAASVVGRATPLWAHQNNGED